MHELIEYSYDVGTICFNLKNGSQLYRRFCYKKVRTLQVVAFYLVSTKSHAYVRILSKSVTHQNIKRKDESFY